MKPSKKRELSPAFVRMAEKFGIYFPTIEPLFTSPPCEKAKASFVDNHRSHSFPQYQELAQAFVDNIKHIPYEQFLTTFIKQIDCFINDLDNQPYVLWLSQNNQHYSNAIVEGCSELWLIGLAFEYSNLPWPVAIETTDQLDSYLKEHPEIKKVLVMDDAIYSGNHLSTELSTLRVKHNDLQLSIVIGYAQHSGQEKIETYAKHKFQSIQFYLGEIIPSFSDILSPELRDFAESIDAKGLSRSLTYYDHAVPDAMSTNSLLDSSNHSPSILTDIFNHMLIKGYYLESQKDAEWLKSLCFSKDLTRDNIAQSIKSDNWNELCSTMLKKIELVPLVFRPYRLHNMSYFEQFTKAYNAGNLGIRTASIPPARLNALLMLLDSSIEKTINSPVSKISTKESLWQFFQPKTDDSTLSCDMKAEQTSTI